MSQCIMVWAAVGQEVQGHFLVPVRPCNNEWRKRSQSPGILCSAGASRE